MQFVKPQVFHVAQTTCDNVGIDAYMKAIGVEGWTTDAPSSAERLIEVMGRGCYRSFAPGLNKNISKIREGSDVYIKNILESKHGSVLEHAGDSYVFLNVSRVFTHELVRNRVGNAFSQESLRYVRLDALRCWFPTIFEELPLGVGDGSLSPNEMKDQIRALWVRTFETLEGAQVEMSNLLNLDNLKNFKTKKMLTSAMRRLAPIGLATMIGYSGNHRSIRWAIQQRTDAAAEEEIRMVFGEVYDEQLRRYPNLYQDAKVVMVDNLRQISFENYKI
jgi:thymidylate synthase (FAD)